MANICAKNRKTPEGIAMYVVNKYGLTNFFGVAK
jgi:hypothetical protein